MGEKNVMSCAREELNKYASQLKISDVGICAAEELPQLRHYLKGRTAPFCAPLEQRLSPSSLLRGAKSIIMCAFAYYAGERADSNISKYVWGLDYHLVIHEKLKALCDFVKNDFPDFQGAPFADTSPMCDKYLAYLAGLGFWGENSLLIHPVFGSYFFIGGIVTNLELSPDQPLDMHCARCHACWAACPAGALGENGVDGFACASYLSQKKGSLSEKQQRTLQRSGKVWGCDICSEVCPHNSNVGITDIVEFRENLIFRLTREMVNRPEQYANRAYAWRGKETLLRNIELAGE